MKAAGFVLGSLLLLVLFTSASMAQGVQRTFVSGLGSDGNPCTRTAPCRTFSQAIMGTNAGGEVVALDSAGYGPFTVNKSLSIIAPPGVYAGISVFGAANNGIDVSVGPSDTVILRGLTINNQGSTGNGVMFFGGQTLHMESCVVNGFHASNQTAGLLFLPGSGLEIKDCVFTGNTHGIYIQLGGTPPVSIDHVRLEGNVVGLGAADGSLTTVRNSLASGGNIGFGVESFFSSVELNIENCVASNNQVGVVVKSDSSGVATIRLSNSTITDNGTGLENQGSPALLLSRGNNTVEGNTTNTMGTIGSYTAK